MKKLITVFLTLTLVLLFANVAFAGVPGHPFGAEFGQFTANKAMNDPFWIVGHLTGRF